MYGSISYQFHPYFSLMFAKSIFASFQKFSIYIRIIYFSEAQLYSNFQITPKTNLLSTRLLQIEYLFINKYREKSKFSLQLLMNQNQSRVAKFPQAILITEQFAAAQSYTRSSTKTHRISLPGLGTRSQRSSSKCELFNQGKMLSPSPHHTETHTMEKKNPSQLTSSRWAAIWTPRSFFSSLNWKFYSKSCITDWRFQMCLQQYHEIENCVELYPPEFTESALIKAKLWRWMWQCVWCVRENERKSTEKRRVHKMNIYCMYIYVQLSLWRRSPFLSELILFIWKSKWRTWSGDRPLIESTDGWEWSQPLKNNEFSILLYFVISVSFC